MVIQNKWHAHTARITLADIVVEAAAAEASMSPGSGDAARHKGHEHRLVSKVRAALPSRAALPARAAAAATASPQAAPPAASRPASPPALRPATRPARRRRCHRPGPLPARSARGLPPPWPAAPPPPVTAARSLPPLTAPQLIPPPPPLPRQGSASSAERLRASEGQSSGCLERLLPWGFKKKGALQPTSTRRLTALQARHIPAAYHPTTSC